MEAPRSKELGKLFPVLLFALLTTSCNFFGKLEEEAARPVGQVAGGQSFLGSWTSISSPTSATGEPSYAISETYTFDPTGAARVELREYKSSGVTCTGFGQFRQVGDAEVIIYVQAAVPSSCAFNTQIHLSQLKVKSQSIEFKDPGTQYTYSYFANRSVAATAPVGVWDFDGEGGIDYIFFDAHGYFLVQTTDDQGAYLLLGYYTVAPTGELSLSFFANMDPTNVPGDPLVYSQFVTDGTTLQLVGEDDNGQAVIYTGFRQ